MKQPMDWAAYCRKVIESYRELDVLSIPDLSESRKMPLDKLYVPLKFTLRGSDKRDIIEETGLDRFGHLVILGDPGSGKSTLVLHTVLRLARDFLEKGGKDAVVPIPIILRDYMQHYKEFDLVGHFFNWLRTDLQLTTQPTEDDLKELCKAGRLLVLLDGIDEVGGPELRRQINEKIYDVARRLPGVRLWCTSRIVGYDESPLPHLAKGEFLEGFPVSPEDSLSLQSQFTVLYQKAPLVAGGMSQGDQPIFKHLIVSPFDDVQIEQFIQHWYTIREWNPRERSERTETLLSAIRANERIGQLAANPLTLSMIAMVHRKLARLPEERAELCRVLTESLVEHWELQKYKNIIPGGNPLYTKNRRLEHLAEYMMGLNPDDKRDGRIIQLPGEEVKRVFKETILDKEFLYRGKEEEASQEADNFLHYIKTRTGILMERGQGRFAFVHLSFQEYLAAAFLKRYFLNRWSEFLEQYGQRFFDSHWEETLLLFFEMAAANDPDGFNELFALLIKEEPLPFHLVTQLLLARPEINEVNQQMAVEKQCRSLLGKDFAPWKQYQNDWKELLEKSNKDARPAALGSYCWQSFLANMPGQGGDALHRWAGHFINCETWVDDLEKTGIFFDCTWKYRGDAYIMSCLVVILPYLAGERQEMIEKELFEPASRLQQLVDTEPEEVVPYILFSGLISGCLTGPLAAVLDFFSNLSDYYEKDTFPAQYLDRALNRDRISTRIIALEMAVSRDMSYALSLALNQAILRSLVSPLPVPLSQALSRFLPRPVVLVYPLVRPLPLVMTMSEIWSRSRFRIIIDFNALMSKEKSNIGLKNLEKRKRLASFWINLGCCHIFPGNEASKQLDEDLAWLITHPSVQPDLKEPWERFGYTLYQIGRNPKDEATWDELKSIIAQPGDADLELMLRILHLKA